MNDKSDPHVKAQVAAVVANAKAEVERAQNGGELPSERAMRLAKQSYIEANAGGSTSFVGKDAVSLYTATVLISAIRLYLKTKMRVNRAYTPTRMLEVAGSITGKTYKRTQLAAAADDLQVWADTMKAALPVIGPEGPR